MRTHNLRYPAGPPVPEVNGILAFAASVGFHPDATQTKLLLTRSPQVIVNAGRQWGKSTTVSLRAVHHATEAPGRLVVVAAAAQRQSDEFLRKVRSFAARSGIALRGDGTNPSLVLPNGSRIVALPSREATIRSFSGVTMLVIDEASRVGDELFHALTPMLATTNGMIWLISTPWGKQGFFYDIWTKGRDWEHISATSVDCPRISREFLERERKNKGDRTFRREYLCEFQKGDDLFFDPDIIDNAILPGEKAWDWL